MLHWCLEVVKLGLGKKGERYLAQFTPKLFALRATQCVIDDILRLQLPFQYFHIMNLMLLVNLTLLGYGMGVYPGYLSSVSYIVTLFIFMGMREVSAGVLRPGHFLDQVLWLVRQGAGH